MPEALEHRLDRGWRGQAECSIRVNEGEPILGKAVGGDTGGLSALMGLDQG